MKKVFNRISWGISTLAQILRNIINLNEKLLFLPLYFILFVYIFARFANSRPYSWLLGVLFFGRDWKELFVDTLLTKLVDLIMRDMSGNILRGISYGESIIGVFFSLKLICYKSNVFFNNGYF